MELELAANAQTVAELPRLQPLIACRDGRPRTLPVKIVWHDSPQHLLLADGLTLAEQRGVRRLERVFPGPQTWLPAQPAPVVAETPELANLPSPLAPLAAFEGRQTTSVHQFGSKPVIVTLARGILRSVTAEQPAARIWLSGDEQAVHSAAVLIAGAEPAMVPIASLAAEAIALATGTPPAPRHHGPPILPPAQLAAEQLSVTDALMHILGHLIDVILANAPAAMRLDAEGPEAVHQMRVAVRRARSALSVFTHATPDGALKTVSDRLKLLGSRLGPTRDWDVFVEETVPLIHQALPKDERLDRLISAASRRRQQSQKALVDYLGSAEFRLLGIELAWFTAAGLRHIEPAAPPAEAENAPPTLTEFAADVLQHRWRKLLSSGKRIEDLDIPSLHAVRLRAKRVRYAAEMFASFYPAKPAHRFINRLSTLQQRLGFLNDGAVAGHLLGELSGSTGRHAYASGVVVGFLAARGINMRSRIVRAFERLRRQPIYWT